MDAAPAAMKGLRRPSGEAAGARRSERWPTRGWTRRPDSGPHSQTRLAKACGMPSSCTYGVSNDSCSAQPNCTPQATDAARSSFRRGTFRGGVGAAGAVRGGIPLHGPLIESLSCFDFGFDFDSNSIWGGEERTRKSGVAKVGLLSPPSTTFPVPREAGREGGARRRAATLHGALAPATTEAAFLFGPCLVRACFD